MKAGESFKIDKLQESSSQVLKQKIEVVLAFHNFDDHISDP